MSNGNTRWDKLADSIAAVVVVSVPLFIGLSALGIFGTTLTGVTATWFGLYSFVVLMSATKLYGKSVYDAVKGVGKGLLKTAERNENTRQNNK